LADIKAIPGTGTLQYGVVIGAYTGAVFLVVMIIGSVAGPVSVIKPGIKLAVIITVAPVHPVEIVVSVTVAVGGSITVVWPTVIIPVIEPVISGVITPVIRIPAIPDVIIVPVIRIPVIPVIPPAVAIPVVPFLGLIVISLGFEVLFSAQVGDMVRFRMELDLVHIDQYIFFPDAQESTDTQKRLHMFPVFRHHDIPDLTDIVSPGTSDPAADNGPVLGHVPAVRHDRCLIGIFFVRIRGLGILCQSVSSQNQQQNQNGGNNFEQLLRPVSFLFHGLSPFK
jgi:hypothetical protein